MNDLDRYMKLSKDVEELSYQTAKADGEHQAILREILKETGLDDLDDLESRLAKERKTLDKKLAQETKLVDGFDREFADLMRENAK